MSAKKLVFGANPAMREVPTGQHAVIKFGKFVEWKTIETEWGQKYSFPIPLFSHPSYESIPSKGIKCNWLSKSVAAKSFFNWIFEDGLPENPKTFDFDIGKEFESKWKLTRLETGGYRIEQL